MRGVSGPGPGTVLVRAGASIRLLVAEMWDVGGGAASGQSAIRDGKEVSGRQGYVLSLERRH